MTAQIALEIVDFAGKRRKAECVEVVNVTKVSAKCAKNQEEKKWNVNHVGQSEGGKRDQKSVANEANLKKQILILKQNF